MTLIADPQASTLDDLRASFDGGRGYLAACTAGIPMRKTAEAVISEVTNAAAGTIDINLYCASAERSRIAFSDLVSTTPCNVALGSTVSVMMAVVATAAPDGAEILCARNEFSSVVMPFAAHAHRGVTVREVPLDSLPHEIRSSTWAVVYSPVQSATGLIAPVNDIARRARETGTWVICDTTQATGWLPLDLTIGDMLVCHTYKWLCSPRGVTLSAITPDFRAVLRPVQAGWYSGADPWKSCYGATNDYAPDASAFDTSPSWQAYVGAAPALETFAATDQSAIHSYVLGLANDFCQALDLPATNSAIVTWPDEDGTGLARLTTAGLTASGRAGRARVAFHVFNDEEDVAIAVSALTA